MNKSLAMRWSAAVSELKHENPHWSELTVFAQLTVRNYELITQLEQENQALKAEPYASRNLAA